MHRPSAATSPRQAARESRRIRSLRPQRPALDPWQPPEVLLERERQLGGAGGAGPSSRTAPVATVFLTGAECPFTCAFCDLWQHTISGPTPAGAIIAQIESALRSVAGLGVERLKLYNASNFFDQRAVPLSDDRQILRGLSEMQSVTVECHPRLVAERCRTYAEALGGRLEVAIGLETVHALAHALLNKGCDLEDFDQAAERVLAWGSRVRAFVLVGVPHIDQTEQLRWVRASVEHALSVGAKVVSLIPVRGGNGELERLQQEGAWHPPSLELLERCLEPFVDLEDAVVQLDPWDLAGVPAACGCCQQRRHERLRRLSLTGRFEPPIDCRQSEDQPDQPIAKPELKASCRSA